MPTFSGNLTTIGIQPRNDLFPEISARTENAGGAGVSLMTGAIRAGAETFIPEPNGDITLTLASTLELVPETRVLLTGRWLGGLVFSLPPLHVPNSSGTLADLLAYSGVSSQQYIVWGRGVPSDDLPGGDYRDLSTNPVGIYKRGPL